MQQRSLYQNNRFFINQEKESALVNLFIEQFRIVVQNMNEELASLSGGNQQKVVLAKYLACNPKSLFLMNRLAELMRKQGLKCMRR